jgi:hypothetical protein
MRKSTMFIKLLVLGCLLVPAVVNAQEAAKSATDTIYPLVEKLQSDVGILQKLKITGFVQAQWQKADTIGSPSFAGGTFTGLDNRFLVRRARLKGVYTGQNTQVVLQLDLKETGVFIKEAYGIYSEPWLKTFSLTGGFFNRPFGHEVEYSSASLESPERARIIQTLFPDEVDEGAKLTIQAPSTSPFSFIKLDAGFFNGNAINPETDKYKDFIGHLSLKKTLLDENLQLSGGVSFYNGGFALPIGTKTGTKLPNVYKMSGKSFVLDTLKKIGDESPARQYIGLDVQATYSWMPGITTIKGEYISGTQPGSAGSITATTSPKGAFVGDVYVRGFSGYYVYLIHRIMQTKHELVVKYDNYDPNTAVSGNDINPAVNKKTSATDLAFTTIGLGWNYYMTSNLKITAYYDMVSNETTTGLTSSNTIKNNATSNYRKDLKDNVLTLRFLYKF